MKKEHQQYLIYGGIALGVLSVIVLIAKNRKAIGSKVGKWTAPAIGRLTSGFGPRKDPLNPSKPQFHNGQDIAIPTGTPVKAARQGSVIFSGYTDAGGNSVVIKHDNGWQTGYAHLSKLSVKVGDKVNGGQLIGLSGSTGKHTTGPHLHFTVTNPMAQKVDPKQVVKFV